MDETETTQPQTDSTQPAQDTAPAWASDLATIIKQQGEQIHRLSSDLGRLQSGLRRGSDGVTPPASADGDRDTSAAPKGRAVSHEDLAAAMQVGQLSAALPEPARKIVDGLVANGDFAGAAEAARLSQAIVDAVKPAPQPESQPRRAPRTTAPAAEGEATPRPRTKLEWRQMASTNPKAFRALNDDPTFDPASLPSGRRR